MIVYKVVHVENGNFFSAIVWNDLKFNTVYRINETARPKIGYLYAFEQLDRARWFANYKVKDVAILEAEAEIEDTEPVICVKHWDTEEMVRFWNGNSLYIDGAPTGTVLCKSITPIREVKDEHNL
jgi:hypothetical protein